MSEHESLQPITASATETLTEAVRSYHEGIWLADEYLAKRGIVDQSAATFQLGVVTDPIPGHERFVGKLCIPYLGVSLDGKDQAWGVRFRCIIHEDCKDFGCHKYDSIGGEPTRMYNARVIKTAAQDSIHVTEGEIDCIILNQCGLPAVAIPGANNWKYHYGRLLAGFNKVYVWGDPDEKGADLVHKVCQAVRSAAGVKLTYGDVNETYLAGGSAALREAMEAVKWG